MTYIMRPSLELTEVYVYWQAIDFRKSHRGLATIVECELGYNPFDGGLYAFTNKQRSKIKCLFWENTGFVLFGDFSRLIWLVLFLEIRLSEISEKIEFSFRHYV